MSVITDIAYLAQISETQKEIPSDVEAFSRNEYFDYPILYDDLRKIWKNKILRPLIEDVYRKTVWDPKESNIQQMTDIVRYLAYSVYADKDVFERYKELRDIRISKKNKTILQHFWIHAGELWSSSSDARFFREKEYNLFMELYREESNYVPMSMQMSPFIDNASRQDSLVYAASSLGSPVIISATSVSPAQSELVAIETEEAFWYNNSPLPAPELPILPKNRAVPAKPTSVSPIVNNREPVLHTIKPGQYVRRSPSVIYEPCPATISRSAK